MARFFADRVAFNTATVGTGDITPGSPLDNSFLAPEDTDIATGDLVYLLIQEGLDFEICEATYASGPVFSRDRTIVSKISAVVGTSNLSLTGDAEVRIVHAAEASAYAVGDRAEIWNATYKYRFDNTGVTDNAAQFAALREDLYQIEIRITGSGESSPWNPAAGPCPPTMPTVLFEPGVYRCSSFPNFALNNLDMRGLGECTLWFAAEEGNVFGHAIEFDGYNGNEWDDPVGMKYNIRFENFRIYPTGLASDTLRIRYVVHSQFNDLHIAGAGKGPELEDVNCALRLEFNVCNLFKNISVTSFIHVTGVLPPNAGGYMDCVGIGCYISEELGTVNSANTFINPIIEGCTIGVEHGLFGGWGFTYQGGTIEGCTTGIKLGSDVRNNVFNHIDMESNVLDFEFLEGSDNNAVIGGSYPSDWNWTDDGDDNLVARRYTEFNNTLYLSKTPGVAGAQLDFSDQDGITIAQGANAPFCPAGQGMLAMIINTTSTATSLYIVGGGGVAIVYQGSGFIDNDTTPAGGNTGVAYDGSSFYRLYNNTGAEVTYRVLVLKLEG